MNDCATAIPRRSPRGPSARTAPSGSRRRGGRCGRPARAWPPAPARAAAPPRRTGRPQRFTRKPGPSAATITCLPIASPASRASASAPLAGLVGGDHLQQLHQRRRVEEVHPHHVLRAPGGAGERRDGDRRGVGREHGRPAPPAGQLREQLALELGRSGAASITSSQPARLLDGAGGLEQRGAALASSRSSPFSAHLLESLAHDSVPRSSASGTGSWSRVAMPAAHRAARCRRPSCRRRTTPELLTAAALPAAELRPALLEEARASPRPGPRSPSRARAAAAPREARAEARLLRREHGLLRQPRRDRRPAGDHLGQLERVAASIPLAGHLVHEARAGTPRRRVDPPSGQHQLHRAVLAHRARASRWVAPPPGMRPSMISGWPNSAVSEATTGRRRAPARIPPPIA